MLGNQLDLADMFLQKAYTLSIDLFGGEDNVNTVNCLIQKVQFLAFQQRWDDSLALAESTLKTSNSIQGAQSDNS